MGEDEEQKEKDETNVNADRNASDSTLAVGCEEGEAGDQEHQGHCTRTRRLSLRAGMKSGEQRERTEWERE